MSFHHYGNPLRNPNYFPIRSTKDIINQTVINLRGVKIMILYINDSHNERAWDFGAHQAHVCKIILLVVKGLKAESSSRDITV